MGCECSEKTIKKANSGQIYIRFIGLSEGDDNEDREKIIDQLKSVLESKEDKENVIINFPEENRLYLSPNVTH